MSKRRKYNQLPAITPRTRPKVLLVGNGITRSFDGCIKIDEILKEEWNKNYNSVLTDKKASDPSPLWQLPFPMQIAVATKNHVQKSMSELADRFVEMSTEPDQRSLISEILDVGFDVLLSTNYSLEFEKTAFTDFSKGKVIKKYKVTAEQTNTQETMGIFQCTELPCKNNPLLWHIHGTALRKDSIVMGHHYYGKLLTEVTKRADNVNRVYRSTQTKGSNFYPLSWIDYFLIGDVYIIGFALDTSEIDIWWLLSYKKMAFENSKAFFYSPSISDEKKLLLDCYGVETPEIPFDATEGDLKYVNYYKRICENIKEENA